MQTESVDLTPGKTGQLLIPKWDEGHAKQEWDKNSPSEVEAARRVFAELKAKGYAAYRVDPKTGDKGEVVKEFDSNLGRIIMLPAFAGG
jgi:hypothetical protein